LPSRTYDVVVVGGGLIGLACAWRVAARGLAVAVVDPAPGGAASHVAAGMLAPVTEVKYGEERLLRLALESLRRYPGFVAELEAATGQIVGLRREGTLVVATDAGDRAMLTDLHDFQVSLGLDASMQTSRECRALEPGLSPDIQCGLLAASDHSVDNRRLAAALLTALGNAGVDVITERVAGIDTGNGTVSGVRLTSADWISCTHAVLAAGPWSLDVDGVPQADRPPVRPVKGEILRLRGGGRAELPRRSVRGLVNGHEIYLVPRADGELVVGATVEESGFDTTVRAGAVRELLRDARAILPGIDELELVETIAGLRPGSPDNRPMVGATSVRGLTVATGHFRNGVLLTPVTADLVADVVTGAPVDESLASLVDPGRFAVVAT
jgi:glycine oxidase